MIFESLCKPKRIERKNTRLKQQFEEFWEPKKLQRGAGFGDLGLT